MKKEKIIPMENKTNNTEGQKLWLGWVASFAASAAFLTLLLNVFAVKEMFCLEFAHSKNEMKDIIMGIGGKDGAVKYGILKMNTIADFGFLASYSLLALFSLKLLLHGLEMKHSHWMVYALAFITGFLDCVENAHLLMSGIYEKPFFSIVYFFAVRLKWGFGIFVLLLVVIIFLYGLVLAIRALKKKMVAIVASIRKE